jgi:putative ABC transport system permease protein
MTVVQNIKIAFTSISGNLTRTVITCLIIAIGIMALVGILTAIDGVESSLKKNMSFMGSNSFNIQNRGFGFTRNRSKRAYHKNITYKQALEFKERYEFQGVVSVNSNNSRTAVVKYQSNKTNPNTQIIGGDEGYSRVSGYEIEEGRDLTQNDVRLNTNVVIIGSELKEQLFNNFDCLNKDISVGGAKLRIVGVFKERKGTFDFGFNRVALTPITLARAKFNPGEISYNIGVAIDDVNAMDAATSYSENLFRQVRRLKIKEASNFAIVKSDSISKALLDNLSLLILGAVFIAGITLLGAAIALMNIMLVSVTERTKEIGTRKAIGARSRTVLNQFVIEAITICQLGGLGGIILGISLGNLVSNLVGGSFSIPWNWMILSIVVCTVVGLAAGIWPAYKASRINPIEALRHE